VLSLLGWIADGWQGAVGAALGAAGVGFSVVASWLGIRMVGRLLGPDGPSSGRPLPGWMAAAWPVTVVLLKLPVVAAAMLGARRIGPPAPFWFLLGLALVYSALVWWALSKPSDEPAP
jgi:hypothetical protein